METVWRFLKDHFSKFTPSGGRWHKGFNNWFLQGWSNTSPQAPGFGKSLFCCWSLLLQPKLLHTIQNKAVSTNSFHMKQHILVYIILKMIGLGNIFEIRLLTFPASLPSPQILWLSKCLKMSRSNRRMTIISSQKNKKENLFLCSLTNHARALLYE